MDDTRESGETAGTVGEGFIDVGHLREWLSQIPDPRAARGCRYRLETLLTLVILGKLGGEDTLRGIAEWVKLRGEALVALLGLARASLPHQTTYERVLGKLDMEAVEAILGAYVSHQEGGETSICIDGKVLRGTLKGNGRHGVHLLAAYAPRGGFVLMQVQLDKGENEQTALPRLLSQLDLQGKVITADAMFTQTGICEQIVTQGGDYILPVKDNQPTLKAEIAQAFVPPVVVAGHYAAPFPTQTAQHTTAQHGRVEWRCITTTDALNDYLTWPHLGQVFRLQRLVRHADGRLTYQVVFGVTSLSPHHLSAAQLLHLTRLHWHIENCLHYVRDVTFHEDASPCRHLQRQRCLATLNNLTIALIRRCAFDFVPQARRYFSFHFDHAIALFFS
jgi:predicted transposase YbfD/YdcC